MTPSAAAGRGRWAVWLAGLVVVVAAGAATAHGLYEVAVGSRTPHGIAWLYPVITDGLALVAYAATGRLAGAGRRYAWSVVVLAAGLSGLAQATYLAGAVGDAPAGLRFGVGAWPAVAAAIAAHLLFLIGATPGVPARRVADGPGPVPWDVTGRPTGGVPPVPTEPHAGQETRSDTGRPLAPEALGMGRAPGMRRALAPGDRARTLAELHRARTGALPSVRALAPGDRARTLAELHRARTGALPSVRELADLADVGRGTADRALSALRTATNGLHVVPDTADEGPDQ